MIVREFGNSVVYGRHEQDPTAERKVFTESEPEPFIHRPGKNAEKDVWEPGQLGGVSKRRPSVYTIVSW